MYAFMVQMLLKFFYNDPSSCTSYKTFMTLEEFQN